MILTEELIDKLEHVNPNGLQISHSAGVLNLTKAIYIRKSLIYLFRMEDAFLFDTVNGYTKQEFINKYDNSAWTIEEIIS